MVDKKKVTVKGLTEEQQGMFEALTTLQQGVVAYTLKGKKPSEAHRLAGGKCRDESRRTNLASEILLVPAVSALLSNIRGEVAAEAKIDAAFILNGAKEVYDRCMQNVKPLTFQDGSPKLDDEGNQIYAFDAKSSIAALKLMGDHVNVMAFKTVTENHHTFDNIPDEDLDARIARLESSLK